MTRPRAFLGLALLTGLNLVNYLDRYVLASVVPPIKAELSLSDGEIGWLSSAFMIGYFATAPLFGYLGRPLAAQMAYRSSAFCFGARARS